MLNSKCNKIFNYTYCFMIFINSIDFRKIDFNKYLNYIIVTFDEILLGLTLHIYK